MKLFQVKQRGNHVICALLQRILCSQSQKTCFYCGFHIQLIKALFKLALLKFQEGRCTEFKTMKLSLNLVRLSLNVHRGRAPASRPAHFQLY